MVTIVMNSESSKTSKTQALILNLTDKIDLGKRWKNCYFIKS